MNKSEKICDYRDCDDIAAKHVHFGLHASESRHRPIGLELGFEPYHRDLCPAHVIKVKERYSDFAEYSMGECPNRASN